MKLLFILYKDSVCVLKKGNTPAKKKEWQPTAHTHMNSEQRVNLLTGQIVLYAIHYNSEQLSLSVSVFSGWIPFLMTLPNRRDTPGLCAFRTHTRVQTASRCPTVTCCCTWVTSLSWVCPPRLRSSTTG